jgi:peptidyl-prolyl cis-trans isomerase C
MTFTLASLGRTAVPRVTRRLAAAGLALGCCIPLAACSAGPGAAAVVDGKRISSAELEALVQRSLADSTFAGQNTNLATVRDSKLFSLVTDRLIVAAIADQKITVSEAEIQTELRTVETQLNKTGDAFYTSAAQGGIAKADVHQVLFDIVARGKLEAKITTPVVHAAHILVKDQATAERILAEVKADPTKFAALAKTNSTDTGSGPNGGDLGTGPAAGYVTPFANAVTTAAIGSYFVVQTSFGWHVVHLISRTDVTIAQLLQQAQTQTEANAAQATFTQYLGTVSKRVGVSVNPRYGTWDAEQGQLVPAPNAISSKAPSAPASSAPGSTIQPSPASAPSS